MSKLSLCGTEIETKKVHVLHRKLLDAFSKSMSISHASHFCQSFFSKSIPLFLCKTILPSASLLLPPHLFYLVNQSRLFSVFGPLASYQIYHVVLILKSLETPALKKGEALKMMPDDY